MRPCQSVFLTTLLTIPQLSSPVNGFLPLFENFFAAFFQRERRCIFRMTSISACAILWLQMWGIKQGKAAHAVLDRIRRRTRPHALGTLSQSGNRRLLLWWILYR
nr:MAG TPA: hypothetical protein [Caudoviricetes sp.]